MLPVDASLAVGLEEIKNKKSKRIGGNHRNERMSVTKLELEVSFQVACHLAGAASIKLQTVIDKEIKRTGTSLEIATYKRKHMEAAFETRKNKDLGSLIAAQLNKNNNKILIIGDYNCCHRQHRALSIKAGKKFNVFKTTLRLELIVLLNLKYSTFKCFQTRITIIIMYNRRLYLKSGIIIIIYFLISHNITTSGLY